MNMFSATYFQIYRKKCVCTHMGNLGEGNSFFLFFQLSKNYIPIKSQKKK